MTNDDSIEDLEFVKGAQQYDQVIRYLINKHELKFSTGDYLIKQIQFNGKWKTQCISNVSNIPKRFICVHEDEYGVKYVRALSSMGERLPYICAVTNLNEYERFIIDPDYAEHLILGDNNKFDFASHKKKERAHRNKISKLNKKLIVKFSSIEDVVAYFGKLPLNSTFYMGWSTIDAIDKKYQILEATNSTLVIRDFKSNHKLNHLMLESGLEERIFFFQEPYKYETI
jgi:hypothetical protein